MAALKFWEARILNTTEPFKGPKSEDSNWSDGMMSIMKMSTAEQRLCSLTDVLVA